MKAALGVAVAALVPGDLAHGQTANPVLIQSSGAVHVGHEVVHANNGQTVRWDLDRGATSWYVIFTGPSPCAGGVKEFGTEAGMARSCSLRNAKPGAYKYSTSDRRAGTKHDPTVIVDQ
jgi:hypothetical protein